MGLSLCTEEKKVINIPFDDFKFLVEKDYRSPNMHFMFANRKITGIRSSNETHRKFFHEMIQESIDLHNHENVDFLLSLGLALLNERTKFINTDDSTEVYASFYRYNVRALIQ